MPSWTSDRIKAAHSGNPIADFIGVKTPFLAPVVLILIYLTVKGVGWIVQKTDKTPMAEELILTTLLWFTVF